MTLTVVIRDNSDAPMLGTTAIRVSIRDAQGVISGARKIIGRWLNEADAIRQWVEHGRPEIPSE